MVFVCWFLVFFFGHEKKKKKMMMMMIIITNMTTIFPEVILKKICSKYCFDCKFYLQL